MKKMLLLIFYFSAIYLFADKIKAQCPPGQGPIGPELIVNGDFEQGNTGFTTGYNYCNTFHCVDDGDYGVHSNPSFLHHDFVGYDHTTGTGNFMMINGATTSGIPVWCQTVNVTPNTTYLFSTWVITIAGSYAPAKLKFTINGIPLGNIFDAPDTFYVWDHFTATWNSGTNTTADICIEAVSTHLGGNDFGLDDISFISCQCNINASAGPNTIICAGDAIQLNSSGGNNYLWHPPSGLNNPNIPDPLAFPDTTTTYSVIISNSTGCTDTIPVTITVDEPFIDAGPDTTINAGDTIIINLNSNTNTINWFPSTGISCDICLFADVFPETTTTYLITATTAFGCTTTDTVTIFVNNTPPPPPIPDEKYLFIPNIFTPGNDGFNDNYEIKMTGYESAFLSIYNRWGQLLFETNEIPPVWDGKVKGKEASEGIYFYILSLNGEAEKYNGFLHLVR